MARLDGTAVRSEAELATAVAARTELIERERLARTMHDGGLVLGEYRRIRRDEPDPAAVLTERETEISRMVSTGRTARQIAETLVVSHRTVQNHIQNTLRNCSCTTRCS